MSDDLLEVENLSTKFYTERGVVSAVDDVSFSLVAGETVGIVGESGSGKSAMVRSITRLIENPGRIEAGSVYWNGRDLLSMTDDELREVRGDEISMVFQHPAEALDPAYMVGTQIVEAIQAHEPIEQESAWQRAVGLLEDVGLQNPEEFAHKYPHEYSGGMAQRALIAVALAARPELLIADEPTTGLDVTTQAQLIELLLELCQDRDMSVLFITHDVSVVSELCDSLMVMYAGRIVERGPMDTLIVDPKHPYTKLFIDSIPRLEEDTELYPIEGAPPNLTDPPSGCRFRTRCPEAMPVCATERPPTYGFGEHHTAACYLYTEGAENE
jgi:peptide/nickel transport system ATP-binding protein